MPPSRSRAVVSVRIARSVAACALPRPSAIASAKLPNSTVSHSQIATVKANQPGWPVSPTIHMTVVNSAPTSTTNMTGLRTISRGSSLRSEPATAGSRIAGSNSERSGRSVIAAASRSSARLSSSTLIDFVARQPEQRPAGVVVDQREHAARSRPRSARRGWPGCARWPRRCRGSTPEADVVTASDGMSRGGQARGVAAARARGRRRRSPGAGRRGPAGSGPGC